MRNKVKIFVLILLFFIMIFTLMGCTTDSYGTKEGKIIEKKFTPAHIINSYIPMHVGKITTIMPILQSIPNKYEFKIQKEENDTIKECWIDVSKEIYEQYEIGDYYEQI